LRGLAEDRRPVRGLLADLLFFVEALVFVAFFAAVFLVAALGVVFLVVFFVTFLVAFLATFFLGALVFGLFGVVARPFFRGECFFFFAVFFATTDTFLNMYSVRADRFGPPVHRID